MFKCKYCEKEFEKIQSLSAHYRHCKLNPNFNEDKYNKLNKEISKKSHHTLSINKKNNSKNIRKERKLICKRCGKEYILNLTDKEFENGKYSKFCSRSCANSRQHLEETKNKISKGIKSSKIFNKNNLYSIYKKLKYKIDNNLYKNPYLIKCEINNDHIIHYYKCSICGKIFNSDEKRNCNSEKYCSLECRHKSLSKTRGGYRIGSGYSKHGSYKGIRCDSTWELAFLIYHLDNNLYIERCKEKRIYFWKNNNHIYYPDFITNEGIIEIKGYITEQSLEKSKQNPDIIIISKNDMKKYLDYAINKYGKDFYKLFD